MIKGEIKLHLYSTYLFFAVLLKLYENINKIFIRGLFSGFYYLHGELHKRSSSGNGHKKRFNYCQARFSHYQKGFCV